ncbi:arginine N-succinyltransferase [Brenneria rubrifaciens]|uniref:Arginine N-succinyltransferase n=1 Tax=Brenneria rubrifaciens TaxID=55213 RepID=A0A4P8QMM4_9GAMM|nr:arginine N-succinyltransferase [Brenneria rubrifaciens]QCR08392.1 arginine N-succinyltransferase [Brenneria rubrifaciens]
MMIIRAVERRDLADLRVLARKSGIGLTTLPDNEETLSARIERAIKTWQGALPLEDQGYLFVLEDTRIGRVVGVSALEVAVGLTEPWYNFRVGTLVHASKTLNVYKAVPTLFLSNDHTGYSELCTLFLDPDYRHSLNGKLLSKVRFLFIAAFREHFANKVVAEMRGYSDEQGNSPFWEGLGSHFFSIDFAQADYLSGTGQKAFIAELMPKHPLYVDFLPAAVREVIGKVHPHTAPARRVLESEGLCYRGYIDIFDGGATLEADIDQLRAVKEGRRLPVAIDETPARAGLPVCLAANDDYQQYRALLVQADPDGDCLRVGAQTAAALGLAPGDLARLVTLNPQEKC